MNIHLLKACEKEEYSRVEYHLNSNLDTAILMLSSIDSINPNMKMPYSHRKFMEPMIQVFEENGIPTSLESTCKLIADYRSEHPSESDDQKIRKTISDFVNKYGKSTTSGS